MKILGKYVRKKNLEAKKTKMINVLNKRKTKSEENEWNWKGGKIERVNEFKYLGYRFNERATDKAHIREIVRKANKVERCVWKIGKRKWGGDFRRKMMMFVSMVESILMWGGDLGMEGTRGDRESARKIFERGARSGQRNARLHSEGRVQEE
jgi:hypothetical protein